MSIELLIIIALFAIGGFAASPLLLREVAVEEMGLLLQNSTSSAFLGSSWSEDDFPEFFASEWDGNGRRFYRQMSASLKGSRYGKSRKMLIKLIRVEDEREAAKAKCSESDEPFRARSVSILEEYRAGGGFESVLAAFILKRHEERRHGIGS